MPETDLRRLLIRAFFKPTKDFTELNFSFPSIQRSLRLIYTYTLIWGIPLFVMEKSLVLLFSYTPPIRFAVQTIQKGCGWLVKPTRRLVEHEILKLLKASKWYFFCKTCLSSRLTSKNMFSIDQYNTIIISFICNKLFFFKKNWLSFIISIICKSEIVN
jgi:hypothetical protein